MRWEVLRKSVIGLLVLLNLVLLIVFFIVRDSNYSASNEEIAQVLEYYAQQEITVDCVINRRNLPKKMVMFSEETAIERTIADQLLPEDYQVLYMDAKVTTYSTENAELLLDAENHLIHYQEKQVNWETWTEEVIEEWVLTKAKQCGKDLNWVCSSSRCDLDGRSYVFTEVQDDKWNFFNYIQIYLNNDQTVEINGRIYLTSGFESEQQEIFPIDELMYHAAIVALKSPEEQNSTQKHLEDIHEGYDLQDDEAVYCMEFIFDQVSVFMNANTNEVLYVVG